MLPIYDVLGILRTFLLALCLLVTLAFALGLVQLLVMTLLGISILSIVVTYAELAWVHIKRGAWWFRSLMYRTFVRHSPALKMA